MNSPFSPVALIALLELLTLTTFHPHLPENYKLEEYSANKNVEEKSNTIRKVDFIRISGQDRYATSVKLTQELYYSKYPNIIISSGDNFPDAITASSLSGSLQIPLLITNHDSLNPIIEDEIKRLATRDTVIYLTGGDRALSNEVEEQIQKLGYSTQRLAGSDRIETSLAIAEQKLKYRNDKPKNVIITDSSDAVSSLAASALATNPNTLHILSDFGEYNQISPLLSRWLFDHNISSITSISREPVSFNHPNFKSISLHDEIDLNQCKVHEPCKPVVDIAGTPSQGLSEIIFTNRFPDTEAVIFFSGNTIVDGLTAGQLASRINSPILPVYTKDASQGETDVMRYPRIIKKFNMNPKHFYLIGGHQVLPDEISHKMQNSLLNK